MLHHIYGQEEEGLELQPHWEAPEFKYVWITGKLADASSARLGQLCSVAGKDKMRYLLVLKVNLLY